MIERTPELHNRRQQDYFDRRLKATMVPRESRYLGRHLDELIRFGGLTRADRLLEIGCGMGRYTILLARRGFTVEAMDLSPHLLERLRGYAGPGLDLPLHAGDIADPPAAFRHRFDCVIGLFMLHHVHDLEACFNGVARVLKPGGRAVFLEPNAYNPLFYVQIAFTPGMTWEGDGGVRHMRRSRLLPALERAGFSELTLARFGFFPPIVANHDAGSRVERILERVPVWRGLLPFQLVRGRLK